MRADNIARKVVPRQAWGFSSWNIFSALVLAPEQASGMVKRVLESYGIPHSVGSGVPEANSLLRTTRLDLVICDFDMPQIDQLACLQPSSSWRGVNIGLVPLAGRHCFSSRRVQVRMPKPVSSDMLARGLKAIYTNMAQQKIATYRHNVPARVVSGTLNHRGWRRTLHQVNVLNMSRTGLCLNADEPLPHGASLTMSLVLPENSSSLHASGSVVWSHNNGRAGVMFDRSSIPEMKKLHDVLDAWLPPELERVVRWVGPGKSPS